MNTVFMFAPTITFYNGIKVSTGNQIPEIEVVDDMPDIQGKILKIHFEKK